MNKQNLREKISKDSFKIFTAGLIATAVLLLVYIVKGIWPFGEFSVAASDMVHGYLPCYYHLYDFLHGEKSLFFDFYTGTGVNMIGIASANGLLSPTNLLLLLFPRENLLDAMGILLVFKVFLCGVSAQWYFGKRFPDIGYFWQTIFAFLYSLSSFTLYYYFHIIWLDIIALFPIVVWAAERLFTKKQMLPLVLSLTACLICSLYMGLMVVICLFFVGGLYVILFSGKKERKYSVCRLGIATVLSIVNSLFINYPTFLQMAGSSRYGESSLSKIFGSGFSLDGEKAMLFFGLQIPIFFIISLFSMYKKAKKTVLFALGTVIFLFTPFFLEGANVAWHFGSYRSFPMRFAFMTTFFFCVLAAVYIEKKGADFEAIESKKSKNIIAVVAAIILGLAFAYIVFFSYKSIGSGTTNFTKSTEKLLLLGISYLIGIPLVIAVMNIKSKFVRRYAIIVICIMQAFGFANLNVGEHSPVRSFRTEHNTTYVNRVFDIYKDEEIDPFKRVSNSDMSLNINYSMLLKRAAIGNWTHQIPERLQKAVEALGHSTTYTLLLETGGTKFSKALLGIKSELTLDGERNLEHTLPTGFVMEGEFVEAPSKVSVGSSDIFAYQNGIYFELLGECDANERLFEIVHSPDSHTKNSATYNFNFDTEKTLYLTAATNNNSYSVSVNGEIIRVPTYMNENNSAYPVEYHNGVLELGTYRGDVEVVVESLNGTSFNPVTIGVMDDARLSALCKKIYEKNKNTSYEVGKRDMTFTVTAKNGDSLFVPVNFDKGWSVKINGKEADIDMVLDSFMAVKLVDGENIVEFSFTPVGLKFGALISISGILLTALFVFLNRKKFLEKLPVFIPAFVDMIFIFAYIIAIVGMYIVPTFVLLIKK